MITNRMLSKTFNRINKLCFNNEFVKIRTSFDSLGIVWAMFYPAKCNTASWPNVYFRYKDCRIAINKTICRNKSVEEITFIILHEMIHYSLWRKAVRKETKDMDENHEKNFFEEYYRCLLYMGFSEEKASQLTKEHILFIFPDRKEK